MRGALLVAAKDLRRRLRDKSAYLIGIVAPFGLAAIFALVFNPITAQQFTITFGVVDSDGGPLASVFVDQVLAGFAAGNDGVAAVPVADVGEARRRVDEGGDPFNDSSDGLDAAFVIPAGFSEAATQGETTHIEVLASRAAPTSAALAQAIAQGFADQIEAVNLEIAAFTAAGGTVGPDTVAAAVAFPDPVGIEDLSAETRQLDANTAMVVGMAAMFLFYVAQLGVIGLLEERRNGTLDRLLAAPIRPAAIIAGEALTAFTLGIASMAVLVGASTWLLGAHWGNPLGVAMLVVALTCSAVGIIGLVAAAARTDEQANTYTSFVAITLAILGGSFFPIAQIGGFMATVSLFTPHAWFIRGLGDLAAGKVTDVLPAVGVLLAFAVVTGAIAWVLQRRMVEA